MSLFLLLVILLYASTIPSYYLFRTGKFSEYIALMLSGIGTIILIKSFKHFSAFRFSCLFPYDDFSEKPKLFVKGLHKHLRHPIYLGLIFIFLGYFLFLPTITSLVHLIALLLYIPVGIYFEEKELMSIFGSTYQEYKQSVPALFPKLKL